MLARLQGWNLATVIVAFASIISALVLWQYFDPNWRQLWTDVVHDRNAHLEAGLGLASDLEHGRLGGFFTAIDRARTWPPLHDVLMVTPAVMVGGPKAAIVPSLICYALSGAFAFFAARRMTGDGTLAGITAALFTLASPANRAFATDVMLESPGACLTLASLAAWLAATQDQSLAAWRRLAIALMLLFFVKYNYWLLVVLAIIANSVMSASAFEAIREAIHQTLKCFPTWCRRQLRHPLTYVILSVAAFIAWIRFTGGGDVVLWGRSVSLRTNQNLATLLYWLILARIAPWWWREGRHQFASHPRTMTFIRWHVLPVLVWFAWPQKLASFFWVLNPSDNVGEFPVQDRLGGYSFYAQTVLRDYHVAPWVMIVAVVLACVGFIGLLTGRLRRGSAAVFLLLLIAIVLTAQHPNRKSRFLHSWIPAIWVAAGSGVGIVAALRPRITQPIAGLGVTALTLFMIPTMRDPGHALEGGPKLDRPSALELSDEYLEHLAPTERPAILSNVPLKFLARWTYLNRFGRAVRPITEVPGFNPSGRSPANAEAFTHWIQATPCDAIVHIDLAHTSPWYVPVPGCAGLEQISELMKMQSRFTRTRSQTIHGATVTIWSR